MKTPSARPLARAASLLAALPVALAGCGGAETPLEPKWSSLYANYLKRCADCHSPSGPGRTSDTEASLDFSTAAKGWQTLTGSATGLKGNFAACNGVPFVVSGQPGKSLLVAAIDSSTRSAFSSGACDVDGIGDMMVKVGAQPPDGFVAALKQWITSGAAND